MKNSSLTTKLIMAFLFLAVLTYFGFQAWKYFAAPVVTTSVYTYRAEHVLALSGYVVRDEEVIDCSDTLVELTRAEGERVARGRRVATVYQNTQALEAEREVSSLREQLEQLQYAQTASRDTEAALRLDTELESDIIALRAALAGGNYAAAGSDVSALKTTVLRREYAYRGNTDLSERIERLEAQIQTASAAVGGGARAITAPFAGTYSAVADGYESVLTPAALAEMSPADLAALTPEPVRSTVGKLIRGDRWYYAAVLTEEDAAPLSVGQSFELAIAGVDTPLPVRVSSLSRAQDGKRLLVLSSDQYLSFVSMLRDQKAELILESYTGLRVPKNALRIDAEGQTGVYCLIGRNSYFKPVEVVYQGEDYCLVRPGEIQAVRDSDLIFFTLRAGDEAIITASELYNGKVIE